MGLQILNKENKNDIINFLKQIGNDFDIHLSDSVHINEYTTKVLENGNILAEIRENNIVGILLM